MDDTGRRVDTHLNSTDSIDIGTATVLRVPGCRLLAVVATALAIWPAVTASAQALPNGDFANDLALDGNDGNLAGAGASTQNAHYFPDGWHSGDQTAGPWGSAHAGKGTIDTLEPGGVTTTGGLQLADGLPDLAADGNDLFLGLYNQNLNEEYAAIAVTVPGDGMYEVSYWWANAGIDASSVNATEDAQVQFFVDSDNDYSNGGRTFTALSTLEAFEGSGSQTWRRVTETFSLAAGTHWMGFAAARVDTYVAVDGASMTLVPEPNTFALCALGLLALHSRARRSRR